MAKVKISNLPAIPSSNLSDIFPVIQTNVTYKMTLNNVVNLFQGKFTSLAPQIDNINMNNNSINNLNNPISSQDAVTKIYVDTFRNQLLSDLNILENNSFKYEKIIGTYKNALVNYRYVPNNIFLVDILMPPESQEGDRIAIQGFGSGGWRLLAQPDQTLRIGNLSSIQGGNLSSTDQWNCLEMVCLESNITWSATFYVGNINFV